MIDPNQLSPELRRKLIGLLAKHEGDFTSAAKAMRSSAFAAGYGKTVSDEVRTLLRDMEEEEAEQVSERARALREHLQRRGAVMADQSLEALTDPYSTQGRRWR